MRRRPLAALAALVLLLLAAGLVAPPPDDVDVALAAPAPVALRAPTPARWRSLVAASPMPEPEPEPEPEIERGRVVGQVVDEHGVPVARAIVYATGAPGAHAHVTDDEGAFEVAAPAGPLVLEAGYDDGEVEWRSRPVEVAVEAGGVDEVALEILLGGAGHAVLADIHEALGLGWEVGADDGPLREGDLLVEVDGRLLADLQPEAVHAALRERPGASVEAVVLREGDDGELSELVLELVAR